MKILYYKVQLKIMLLYKEHKCDKNSGIESIENMSVSAYVINEGLQESIDGEISLDRLLCERVQMTGVALVP